MGGFNYPETECSWMKRSFNAVMAYEMKTELDGERPFGIFHLAFSSKPLLAIL